MQKHPRQLRLRQFVPLLFVSALIVTAFLALLGDVGDYLLGAVSGLYVVANFLASILTASRRGWKYLPVLPIAFLILHFSYGLGFITGLFRFANRWNEKQANNP